MIYEKIAYFVSLQLYRREIVQYTTSKVGHIEQGNHAAAIFDPVPRWFRKAQQSLQFLQNLPGKRR